MKRIEDVALTTEQEQALAELRRALPAAFPVERLVLFGSVARGEADEESDTDVLVVLSQPFTRAERHEITDLVFDINLRYGTNLSTLVVDEASWEHGPVSILPIHQEILRDGVTL